MPRYTLTAMTMIQNVSLERILVYMLRMLRSVVLYELLYYGVDLLTYVFDLCVHCVTLFLGDVFQLMQ